MQNSQLNSVKTFFVRMMIVFVIIVSIPCSVFAQSAAQKKKNIRESYLNQDESGSILIKTSDTVRFIITENGNVGIGLLSPEYNLDIRGTMRAEEVIVEPSDWPDFVFEAGFEKMDWRTKELFYIENKHLPYIQSGKDILNNGLKTTEIMQGMMQNIEENRLDISELYRMIEELKLENLELRKLLQEKE